MSAFRALLLGVLAYGIFLVATAPASVAAPRVAAATQGQVKLTELTGTVWRGAAHVDVASPGLALTVDEVRWRFLASRLFTGRVAFAVEARMGSLRGQAEAARSPLAWHLRDLDVRGDASAITAFLPLAAAWQPAGPVAIDAKALSWNGTRATGSATIAWLDATLALSQARPLGSWRAQATAEGAALRIALATTKGPLHLSGTGTLPIPGRLAFSGEARAEPGRERELEPLLDLLGPRRADGARALELR